MRQLGSIALAEPLSAAEAEQDTELKTVPTAELAECTCPDFCERDHDTD
jgi:hypothetical protein